MLERRIDKSGMRVVHVAQTTAGGIASYLEEIAGYQTDRYGESNVAFVTPSGAAHLPNITRAQLTPFKSAARSPSALLDFTGTALRAIDRLEPAIVHLHSTFAGAVLRPLLRMRRRRPQIVYCPHGWAFTMDVSAAKQRAYALIERRLAALSDLVHVNSRSEFDIARDFGVPEKRMQIIANGIGWTQEPPRVERQGPLRLIFIGRHDRQKGLDLLLDTLARFDLPGIHFDIVGDGIVSEASARSPGSGSNCTFHGWLPRKSALELLDQADALVMPSRWDAAPIVAIEAMRAGVPVIGSNRGGIPEIVGHQIGGMIFDLDDPDSLGSLLRRLDRESLARLGRQARERWESRYTSDRMNALTCRIYESLVAAPAEAPR